MQKKRNKKRTRIFILIALISSLAVILALLYQANKVGAHSKSIQFLESARQDFAGENYANAIKHIEKSIEYNPNNEDAYLLAAKSYFLMGNPRIAVKYYYYYLSKNPRNSEAKRELGNAFLSMGEQDLALIQYKAAVGLNSSNFLALNSAGRMHTLRENHRESLKYYNRSLNILFNEPAAEGFGTSSYFLGDYKNSIPILSKLYESGRISPFSFWKLALSYTWEGQPNKAIEMAEKELKDKPDNNYNNYKYYLYHIFGTAYLQKWELNNSIYFLNLAIENLPDSASHDKVLWQYELGMAYLLNNDNKNAIKQFKSSLSVTPMVSAARALKLAYELSGNMEDANKVIENGLSIGFMSPPLLGKVYMDHALYDKAEEQFLLSISMKPDYYLPYEQLGVLYLKLGNISLSRQYFEKSLNLNPQSEISMSYINT